MKPPMLLRESGAEMVEAAFMIAIGVAVAGAVAAFYTGPFIEGLRTATTAYYHTLYGSDQVCTIDPIGTEDTEEAL